MDKFQNKYRIESARLASWDYRWPGAYFITICTKNREHFFGSVINQQMQLSKIGELAHSCWTEIPAHAMNILLGEFVIMPDHVHGIIIIDVETRHASSLHSRKNSISSIVGGFKSSVTRLARPVNSLFNWQSRFYDRIIRDREEFIRISDYIRNNPANWKHGNENSH
ncbi:MAG: transposase [Chitinophagaceae bacterium]|nr:transposase [Chitinophagaceae bacterium]